jgi:hypothetical protein
MMGTREDEEFRNLIEKKIDAEDHARRRGEFERQMRINQGQDGIYKPDTNLYLVENQGDNRAARRADKTRNKKK